MISILSLVSAASGFAQTLYPSVDAPRVDCTALIEMEEGYLSGVCVLKRAETDIRGCIFNEFGLSALSFTYVEDEEKVKLHELAAFLDKWYIRRTLRKDIAAWMRRLQDGGSSYVNARRNITYRLMPMEEENTQTQEL